MKKILNVIFIIICLLLVGCSQNNKVENPIVTDNINFQADEILEKYYDESRLNNEYTLNESTNNFSFIINYSDSIKEVYSYIQNEKVEFFNKDKFNLNFIYFFNSKDATIRDVETVSIGSFGDTLFVKENYQNQFKLLESDEIKFEVIEETENYAIIKSISNQPENITYFAVKFLGEDNSVVAFVRQSEANKSNPARYIESLKGVLNTITEDNGDAILEDKISLVPNYQNKKLKSALYISYITREGYKLTTSNGFCLGVDEADLSYITKWEKLSNNGIDIYINNDEKLYKVVIDGKNYFYQVISCNKDDYECKGLQRTASEFEKILNMFYE